jgi:conjugal transfer pilus assembly protein TraB
MMEIRNVKLKQYKTLFIVFGAVAAIFVALSLMKKSEAGARSGFEPRYTRNVTTGVEGLNDREMWMERSSNEIAETKAQNKKLQEQNERLQKQMENIERVMAAIGVKTGVFGRTGERGKRLPSSDSSEAKNESAEISEESVPALDHITDFVERSKNVPKDAASSSPPEEKILGGGMKTISYANTDSEHDLDENLIFATTFARGILLGSLTVSAGIGSSSNPQPVTIQLTDLGNLPDSVNGIPLKGARLIGAAYGELSSESIVIRLERLVKLDRNLGLGIDIPVKGYIAGENGDSRIRGMVYDRAGAVLRSVAAAGFLSGMGEFLNTNNSSAVTFEPNSGLAQFSPQKGAKMLEQGASKGIGNAMEKYADFYIKRAEQLQPVIKIDGGRKVTAVFTESVKASAVHMKKVRRSLRKEEKGNRR